MKTHKTLRFHLTLALLISLLASAWLWRCVHKATYFGDETYWVEASVYYTDLLSSGDFDRGKWEGYHLGPWGWMNPQLGKWILGFPLERSPDADAVRQSKGYLYSLTYDENLRQGRIAPPDALRTARRTSAVCGGLCCGLIYLIGALTLGVGVGAIAAGLTLTNALFVLSVTRAMTDASYNMFLAAFFAASVWLYRGRDSKAIRNAALVCGVMAALATNVKIQALPVCLAISTLLLAYKFRFGDVTRREALKTFVLVAAVAVALIYLLNPCLLPLASDPKIDAYLQPISMGREHTLLSQSQPLLGNRIARFPALFLEWSHFMKEQEQAGPTWNHPRLLTIHFSLLGKYGNFRLEALLAPFAIVWGARRGWLAWRLKRRDDLLPILLFFGVNYLVLLALLQLNWDRYYLPTILTERLLLAAACVALGAAAQKRREQAAMNRV